MQDKYDFSYYGSQFESNSVRKKTAKHLILILKIIALPILGPLWLQIWLIKKIWRYAAVLFFVSLIGCTSTSNKFSQSPCACEFEPANISNYVS